MGLIADTDMTDEWIATAMKNNPCTLLPSGNIRTCPVRLSFPNIFHMSQPKKAGIQPSYGANLIFPVGADLKVLQDAIVDVLRAKCPDALSTDPKKKVKVKLPILNQSEMLKYEGYSDAEGAKYIIATSKKNKPACVDLRAQPITDESRVHPGVWAIATIRPFWYDVDVNKGVSFGLQSVMIVADDRSVGGGGFSASDYEGVNIDSSVNVSNVFDSGDDESAALFA